MSETAAVRVRPATAQDLEVLGDIEAAADTTFEALLGPSPFGDDPPPTGTQRAAEPGFVLAAVVDGAVMGRDEGPVSRGTAAPGSRPPGSPIVHINRPVGFVHVLERDGQAHLEQLAVLPGCQGQGLGTALVEAACREARRRGHRTITLRTYAEVAFNGPYYARRGFEEVPVPSTDLHRELERAEQVLDLARHGRRIVMRRDLDG